VIPGNYPAGQSGWNPGLRYAVYYPPQDRTYVVFGSGPPFSPTLTPTPTPTATGTATPPTPGTGPWLWLYSEDNEQPLVLATPTPGAVPPAHWADPYITYYDHATGTWATSIKIADAPFKIIGDGHNHPTVDCAYTHLTEMVSRRHSGISSIFRLQFRVRHINTCPRDHKLWHYWRMWSNNTWMVGSRRDKPQHLRKHVQVANDRQIYAFTTRHHRRILTRRASPTIALCGSRRTLSDPRTPASRGVSTTC
jgi:hypothetical protein